MDCSTPGLSVYGILQGRILEQVAISFSRGSSQTRDLTHVSCTADGFFTTEPLGKTPKTKLFPLIAGIRLEWLLLPDEGHLDRKRSKTLYSQMA